MPQRAKVSRVCLARNGICSVMAERAGARRLRGCRSRTARAHRAASPGQRRCGRRRLDLDQRLQPIHAARAIANDLAVDAARRRSLLRIALATLSAPSAKRAGIARDVDARRLIARTSAAISSSRAASSRPITRRRASPRRAGAEAEAIDRLQRHRAVRRRLVPSRCRATASRASASASPPIDWQASARQSFSTWRPAGWLAEIMIEGDDAVDFGAGEVERLARSPAAPLAGHSRTHPAMPCRIGKKRPFKAAQFDR